MPKSKLRYFNKGRGQGDLGAKPPPRRQKLALPQSFPDTTQYLKGPDLAMATNLVAKWGKITYPCTYRSVISIRNGISLSQCAR